VEKMANHPAMIAFIEWANTQTPRVDLLQIAALCQLDPFNNTGTQLYDEFVDLFRQETGLDYKEWLESIDPKDIWPEWPCGYEGTFSVKTTHNGVVTGSEFTTTSPNNIHFNLNCVEEDGEYEGDWFNSPN
jgi:hypothetical protein